MLGTPT